MRSRSRTTSTITARERVEPRITRIALIDKARSASGGISFPRWRFGLRLLAPASPEDRHARGRAHPERHGGRSLQRRGRLPSEKRRGSTLLAHRREQVALLL